MTKGSAKKGASVPSVMDETSSPLLRGSTIPSKRRSSVTTLSGEWHSAPLSLCLLERAF